MTGMNTFHLCKDGMPLFAHPDSVGTVHEKKKKNDVALNKPSINVLKMHKSKGEKKKKRGTTFPLRKKKKKDQPKEQVQHYPKMKPKTTDVEQQQKKKKWKKETSEKGGVNRARFFFPFITHTHTHTCPLLPLYHYRLLPSVPWRRRGVSNSGIRCGATSV